MGTVGTAVPETVGRDRFIVEPVLVPFLELPRTWHQARESGGGVVVVTLGGPQGLINCVFNVFSKYFP